MIAKGTLAKRARAWFREAGAVLTTIVGVPDYERYVRHLGERHPEVTPLERKQFTLHQLGRRYDRPGSRCC
jgi:uncharacterized short protein YbdD (DUF466 family)